jgi:putative oxidoreductase
MKGLPAVFRKIISTSSSWATVPIRLALAAVFVFHGAQKVFGSFGGPGLNPFINHGPAPFSFMRPAWLWWGLAAFSELLGGILIFLGLLTRIGAFLVACVMLTAIIAVHWPAGFLVNKGGYEYALALFAMSLALMIAGGGMASIDRALSSGRRR